MLTLVLTLVTALAPAPIGSDSFPTPIVDATWLARHQTDPNVIILHVARARTAYDSAHIAGARFLELGQIAVTNNGISTELPEAAAAIAALERVGVSDDSRVVIYGEFLAATRLWFTLDWLGLGGRAAVLDGGLDAWRALGKAVTATAPSVTPGHLTAKPNAAVVVDANWVRERLGKSDQVLIDARNAEEFRGEKEEEGVTRPGHIPGATNLDWNSTLADGRFKSMDEIRGLFQQAGATTGKEVVTYCRSGTRSSVLHLLARALGYPSRMYDGSMMDWSRRSELPVEK